MKPQKIFCSACDREVSVVFTDEPLNAGGQATIPDPELVCLEMGVRCNGALCPVTAVSGEAMGVRVAKSGMRPDQHSTIRAVCDGCKRETDLMVTRGGYATCSECGTTRRMVRT